MNRADGAVRHSRLWEFIAHARQEGGSDVHVAPGEGVALRLRTEVVTLHDYAIDANQVRDFLALALDRRAQARLESIGICDAFYHDTQIGAVRVHASRGRFGPKLAIRLLAHTVPDLESLNLPPVVATFGRLRSGLIVFSGPGGAGKTTALASLVERVNATRRFHIVTLESTVEYHHPWQQSIVSQHEVGRDVATFADGVNGALHADSDILCIGEVRDAETVSAMLQATEAGQLVFASLRAPSGTLHVINRIVGLFSLEEQGRVRARLADALRALVTLRLLPRRDGTGLWPACEILIASDAIRRMLREGTIHQIRGAILSARKDGSQTLERHLSELVGTGVLDLAAARSVSDYPDEIVVDAHANSRT
jgi:twitching motility protein PilT